MNAKHRIWFLVVPRCVLRVMLARSLPRKIRLLCYLFASCFLVIGLNVTPAVKAGEASIVTDEDIIGGGVSLQVLKATVCEMAVVLSITPLPPLCLLESGERFVFVTSTPSNGSLGGLAGADATCNTLAAAAGLSGTYAAWLSTSAVDAKDRIGDHTWKNRVGDVVANNLADLIDGLLDNPINVDEEGNAADVFVWTGTGPTGVVFLDQHCEEWISLDVDDVGAAGLTTNVGSSWTQFASAGCSVASIRMLCFGL